jgi:hypothetical protein
MDRRSLCLLVAVWFTGCSDIPVNHDTEEQCGCVSQQIRMSPVGAPVQSLTTIDPCRKFTLRVEAIADRPTTACSTPIVCPGVPGQSLTGVDIERAAQHPDVQAALTAGIPRYGAGQDIVSSNTMYRVGIGGSEFEVGAACGDTPDCVPIPAGLEAFIDMMNKVSSQEIRRDPCRVR